MFATTWNEPPACGTPCNPSISTGVAGPDSQEGHLVGTVWIAVAGPDGVVARGLTLDGDRSTIRQATCEAAMSVLDDMLGRTVT